MKLVFIAVVLGGLAATSWGFLPNYRRKALAAFVSFFVDQRLLRDTTHKEMTKTALVQVAIDSLKEKFKHDPAKYDGVTDLDKIVKLAYGSSAVSKYFRRVMTAIQKANAAVDFKMESNSAAHFDAENIVNGSNLLLARFISAKKCIFNNSYDDARESVGKLLHGLQDFYSHSNWIEKEERDPNLHLATMKREPLRAQDVALPNYPTCVNCNTHTCRNNIAIINPVNTASAPLTSGYYHKQDIKKPVASSLDGGGADGRGKCSHGGFFDKTASTAAKGGINKDSGASLQSPHWYLHEEAADMATRASVVFLTELREEVGVDRFLAFLGLYRSYSFTIVLDTTVSMVEEVSSIHRHFDSIVKAAAAVPPDEYVLVPFNHACAGPVYRSSSADEFKEKLKSMSTSSSLAKENGCVGGQNRPSGSDHPKEKTISGLILALQTSRPGSTVYVFTDSDAIDIDSYPEASLLAERKRITVFFIRSRDNKPSESKRRRRRDTAVDHENVYAKLAEESGGQVLIPDKDDDVGNLLARTSSLSNASDSTLLLYEQKSPTDVRGRNLTLNVDEFVSSLTVSLSGENTMIVLYDPNGQVVALDPSSVTQRLTAIRNVESPSSGTWTINVNSTNEFDVLVKGTSSLDFQYSLLKRVETLHPGLFEVPEKPKIGDIVYVEVTVTGLTNETTIDEVHFLLTTDRQVKERLSLEAVANETALFITETNVTILEDPFQILLVGHYGSKTFTRVAKTPIMPIAFGLTLQGGDLVMRQGETKTLKFLVERGSTGEESVTSIFVQNDLGFAVNVRDKKFILDPGQSRSFFVDVTVPVCYPESAVNTFTLTATLIIDKHEELVDSVLVNVLVDSEFVDKTRPVCFLSAISTAGCTASPSICDDEHWSATLSVIDTSSSLVIAEVADVDPDDAVANISLSLPLERNKFHFVNVTTSCCAKLVTLQFTDDSGNSDDTCTVHKTDVPKRCSVNCLNGGRCNSRTQKCQCIGGYFGNQCERAGCNTLSAPANGYVSDSGVGSINKSVGIFCKEAYVHAGKSTSTCCPFGWTDSSAWCFPVFNDTGTGRGYSASAKVALIFTLAAAVFLLNTRGHLA